MTESSWFGVGVSLSGCCCVNPLSKMEMAATESLLTQQLTFMTVSTFESTVILTVCSSHVTVIVWVFMEPYTLSYLTHKNCLLQNSTAFHNVFIQHGVRQLQKYIVRVLTLFHLPAAITIFRLKSVKLNGNCLVWGKNPFESVWLFE